MDSVQSFNHPLPHKVQQKTSVLSTRALLLVIFHAFILFGVHVGWHCRAGARGTWSSTCRPTPARRGVLMPVLARAQAGAAELAHGGCEQRVLW